MVREKLVKRSLLNDTLNQAPNMDPKLGVMGLGTRVGIAGRYNNTNS